MKASYGFVTIVVNGKWESRDGGLENDVPSYFVTASNTIPFHGCLQAFVQFVQGIIKKRGD